MKAILCLFTATFLWGLNFHLGKVLLKEASFIEAGFWRYLFGILPLLLLSVRSISLKNYTGKDSQGIILVGLVGLFGFNFFFFYGLENTSAINAACIISLNPALTTLLATKILNVQVRIKDMSAITIGLLGVLYLSSKGNPNLLFRVQFNYGDLLILVSNVFFALHHVWVKKYNGRIPTTDFTLLTNLICFICFSIFFPYTDISNFYNHSIEFWIACIGIGCLGTSLAYILWNKGIQMSSAHKAGLFMNVTPLSTAFLSLFFNESLYPYHWIGGGIILCGLLIKSIK